MNLGTIGTVVVCLALLWFLYRLARAPRDLALRAVVACLAFQLVVTPLGNLAAAAEHGGSALPGLAKLAQNLAIADSWFSLMLFFLFSTSSSRRRAWHEFFVLLGASALITLSMLATPAAARDHTFTGANMRIPGVAGFYLSAGCYFAYVLAQATRSALRYAGESNWRMRLGLRVASIGLALNAATCLIRGVFVIMRFSGGTVPPGLNAFVRRSRMPVSSCSSSACPIRQSSYARRPFGCGCGIGGSTANSVHCGYCCTRRSRRTRWIARPEACGMSACLPGGCTAATGGGGWRSATGWCG